MELRRRELLAAFLGAAVANAACRKPRRVRVPGAIVDTAVNVGHRLKDGPLPRAAAVSRTVQTLVIGGGIAGLSAGWRLRGAGESDFLILELDDAAGGTSRSGASAVTAYPWGAHYLPAPTHDRGPVARILRELGVLTGVEASGAPRFAEETLLREPEVRIFYRGAWYEGLYLRAGATPEDLSQLARFEARMADFARARDGRGRKAFEVPAALSSDDAEWTGLDRLSMGQWLSQEGFTSERLRWTVDYACRDDFGARASDVSAWAGIWYFASRQSGDARSEGFLAWPEGNGRLVRHLAEAVGAERLHSGVLVHAVEPEDEGVSVHALRASDGAPLAFRAREVIVAAPRYSAARLFRTAGLADGFVYSPWVVANVHVSEAPKGRGFPLAWDNVFYESESLGYVVATHQRPRASDVGPTVLTWYYPFVHADAVAERRRMLSLDYDGWEELVMSDLLRAHPTLRADRVEVHRWGHAMIRPVPGALFGERRAAAGRAVHPRVHFANTDLSGVAVFEDANHHGVAAAERVLANLGRQTVSWL